ncbi:hypothetical protein J5N97_023972 [Dioscorea zingiberensis]|uniref:Isochorismatase-like domain-containing protein n=1 Tax=Dioscorea zingiberensis TaxID=325984 RepID=A0A9D5C615_9LILI|nr:hypothetical protein J5N97_023972 [Dioscorea zingiberensis]
MASSYLKYATRRRNPSKASAALLVIDIQNHFASIAAPILPALRATIDHCRSASIPIIFTRHRHRSPADHSMLGEWWNNLILEGTPDAELLPDIGRQPGDRIVEKDTYSAFRGTGLEETLKEMGVEEWIARHLKRLWATRTEGGCCFQEEAFCRRMHPLLRTIFTYDQY